MSFKRRPLGVSQVGHVDQIMPGSGPPWRTILKQNDTSTSCSDTANPTLKSISDQKQGVQGEAEATMVGTPRALPSGSSLERVGCTTTASGSAPPGKIPLEKKFGRFMGKMLLLGNKKNNDSSKTQPGLKEVYPHYFRVEKPKADGAALTFKPTNDTPSNLVNAPSPLVSDLNAASTAHGDSNLTTLIDTPKKRKSRWDIRPPSSTLEHEQESSTPEQTGHTSLNQAEEGLLLGFGSDDDLSSLSSLSSDDDVQRPWSQTDTTHSPSSAMNDINCKDCKELRSRGGERGPFDTAQQCPRCIQEWKRTTYKLLANIKRIGAVKKVRTPHKQAKRVPSKEAISQDADGTKRVGRSKKLPPPTKSRHTHVKEKSLTKKDYVTTGAFMTRNTAKKLVDPFGFRPNPYHWCYGQQVKVLNINGYWYRGELTAMNANKVKVCYIGIDDQEEWIHMGSRRLRVVKDEDRDMFNPQVDTSLQTLVTESRDSLEHPSTHTQGALTEKPVFDILREKKKKDDDYVSSTLDTDPTQVFNDNEVFMTRRMARQLMDEHGFRPNSFGYRYNRVVSVTILPRKGAHRAMQELIGRLREMKDNKVRVWYPSLQQYEWLECGSRRLRVLVGEEERTIDDDPRYKIEEMAPTKTPAKPEMPKKSKSTVSKQRVPTKKSDSEKSEPERKRTKSAVVLPPKERKGETKESLQYLTTGAFATRCAMRQLKDEHGFVPNAYGYVYNQSVEILNTRIAKSKFWERGHLVEMAQGKVKVRYDDWGQPYDEWIMVGSRRIRIVSLPSTGQDDSTPAAEASLPTMDTGLLLTENNPELLGDSRKRHEHRVFGIEDYKKLGLVMSMEEWQEKEAKKREKAKKRLTFESLDCQDDSGMGEEGNDWDMGDDSEDGFSDDVAGDEGVDDDYGIHRRKRARVYPRKRKYVTKKKSKSRTAVETQKTTISVAQGAATSLRLAQRQEGFVANEYGYDYMQHVQVLHSDKKWYEGRLVAMERNRLHVHFCGWPDAFDQYVTVGSRRLQMIENDHEVECMEPSYRERYENGDINNQQLPQKQRSRMIPMARRRFTLDDQQTPESEHADNPGETDSDKVHCNQCHVVIKQFRYYCTYCEIPCAEGQEHQSFELCLQCFDNSFPFWHEHPRSSFAIQSVIDAEVGPRPIRGELVTVWEEDVLDTQIEAEQIEDAPQVAGTIEASQVFAGDVPMNTDEGYKYLKRWQRRKLCAFCNDDDDQSEELGQFIGPFIIATFNKNGIEKKRSFWAHDACARHSPEVFCTPEGKWYNVTLALRRGRGMRCHVCKEKGATIGCFESKCSKSFHLPCAQKPISYFQNGVIFWCPTHEAYYNKKDTYVNIFSCDGCNKELKDESWFTCLSCASSYFSSFDLCAECFEKFPSDHTHGEEQFEETSFAILKEMEAQKATEAARAKEESRAAANAKKKPLFPRRKRRSDGSLPVSCCYCGTQDAEQWRKGYDGGVLMCQQCFDLALLIDSDGKTQAMPLVNEIDMGGDTYATFIEDYTHKPYLTRDALSAAKFSEAATGPRLTTYEPQPYQFFSLVFDSTYFDIPGRAPRWATHSGTDYHGTWLPQTVRRAILKYTEKDERILSNFLGRGTDAIECFLLQRRCCGVDINPAAVALSQRNCCFELPAGLTSAEYRPIVAQADSRQLSGALFANESFHHVLSHPPYKDCVAYSTHLEGDLSRFTNIDDFKTEYDKVVRESWRLLKMGRRLTLGIGDNREHCFYIPVGFHLLRQYIDNGFELEELIIKRQRYCSAFGLGTYLCVQFDFLVFTHEFIATFRKIPLTDINRMTSLEDSRCQDHVRVTHSVRGVPSSAITRKSVVMGTVWVFRPTEKCGFERLCMSRMVERFGKDDGNWEHVQIDFMSAKELQEQSTEKADETTEQDMAAETREGDALSDYELERRRRIEENNRTLLKLGLISELSEESDDIIHFETMMKKPPHDDAPLVLMVMEHQQVQSHQISLYRQSIVDVAREACKKLCPQGMLVIGTQDIRDESGKLWPMSMLILEDIERTVDRSVLKLKEMVVAVPEGHSRDRHQKLTEAPYMEQEGHLSIVHAIYLVFQQCQ